MSGGLKKPGMRLFTAICLAGTALLTHGVHANDKAPNFMLDALAPPTAADAPPEKPQNSDLTRSLGAVMEQEGTRAPFAPPVILTPPTDQDAPKATLQEEEFAFSGGTSLTGDRVPNEVLVLVPGDFTAVAAIAETYGLVLRSSRPSVTLGGSIARYTIPEGRSVTQVLAQMKDQSDIVFAGANHLYKLDQVSQLPNYAVGSIKLDAFGLGEEGRGARIAIIDSGVDESHPALAGAIIEQFDAIPDVPLREVGHGTSVAVLAAGRGQFNGAAPAAELLVARAFDVSPEGETLSTVEAIVTAIDWAIENDAQIINMSFSGPRNTFMEKMCAAARARGVILMAAAGNQGPRAPFAFPAAFDSVIAITATDANKDIMAQANQGRYIGYAAPGVDLIVPQGNGAANFVTGTSFAVAYASGLAARLVSINALASAEQVEQMLTASAEDLGEPGLDNVFGHGLLNGAKAREIALAGPDIHTAPKFDPVQMQALAEE